jgi:hypothetical protein
VRSVKIPVGITLVWAEAAELIRRTQGTPVLLSFPRMRRTGGCAIPDVRCTVSRRMYTYISQYDEGYLLPRGVLPVSKEGVLVI